MEARRVGGYATKEKRHGTRRREKERNPKRDKNEVEGKKEKENKREEKKLYEKMIFIIIYEKLEKAPGATR